MKIVKAQKVIKRLKGEIAEIQQRISNCLSTLEENDFDGDFNTLMKTLSEKTRKLIELKVKVMKSNVDNKIFTTILNLGELKSRLEFIKGLSPIVGSVRASYGEGEKSKYKTQLLPSEKTKMIEDCQSAINEMTDSLDDFNAVTDISEDEVRVNYL